MKIMIHNEDTSKNGKLLLQFAYQPFAIFSLHLCSLTEALNELGKFIKLQKGIVKFLVDLMIQLTLIC